MTRVRDLVASAHKFSAYREGPRLGVVNAQQIRGAERRRIASEVIAIRAAADLTLAREIADREGIPIETASRGEPFSIPRKGPKPKFGGSIGLSLDGVKQEQHELSAGRRPLRLSQQWSSLAWGREGVKRDFNKSFEADTP